MPLGVYKSKLNLKKLRLSSSNALLFAVLHLESNVVPIIRLMMVKHGLMQLCETTVFVESNLLNKVKMLLKLCLLKSMLNLPSKIEN